MASKHHINVGTAGYKLRCKGCRCPIVYGERCQDCQRKLRLRQRRKPR
jgi:hypothetical protein